MDPDNDQNQQGQNPQDLPGTGGGDDNSQNPPTSDSGSEPIISPTAQPEPDSGVIGDEEAEIAPPTPVTSPTPDEGNGAPDDGSQAA